VIGINVDDNADDACRFAREHGIAFPP